MDVLVTSGLGDFIAVESWLSPQLKNQVTRVFWATRARAVIQQSIDLSKVFPNAVHVTLFDRWADTIDQCGNRIAASLSTPYCLYNKYQIPQIVNDDVLRQYNTSVDDIVDLSICPVIDSVDHSNIVNYGSSYASVLPSYDQFNGYVVIHPYSSNAYTYDRDLTQGEVHAIFDYLNRNDLKGVYLGTGRALFDLPTNHNVVNMIDKLDVQQSFDVVRQSSMFIGCASSLSVLASRYLPHNQIHIKGSAALDSNKYGINHHDVVIDRYWCRPLSYFYYLGVGQVGRTIQL